MKRPNLHLKPLIFPPISFTRLPQTMSLTDPTAPNLNQPSNPIPTAPSSSPQTLRILLLHGYTQTAPLFRSKTRALAKSLARLYPADRLSLTYVSAPHPLVGSDIPGSSSSSYNEDHDDTPSSSSFTTAGERETDEAAPEAYGWWKRKDVSITRDGQARRHGKPTGGEEGKEEEEAIYTGLEASLSLIADVIKTAGPFDGVIGFSQGAALAAMLASLLEGPERKRAFDTTAGGGMGYPACFLTNTTTAARGDDGEGEGERGGGGGGMIQPPLKFAVCYSGFRAPPGRRYGAFYEPRIQTPILHVLGQVDVVVEEARARELVGVCEGGGRVVVHPGGHFVPSQRPWLDAVVGFVRERMEEGGKGEGGREKGEKGEEEEERVEDMEVPF